MTWEAEELEEYLQITLEEQLGAPERISVRVEAPEEEGPGSAFYVVVRAGTREIRADVPSALVKAYLADEEAAVDEFKRWVAKLVRRLAITGA